MQIRKSLLLSLLSSFCFFLSATVPVNVPPSGKIIVAYVTSWNSIVPEPQWVTHINYAFGHVNETFNGVKIDNPERLHMISGLKKEYPHLKVMLSIGGWTSGRFSEMAATEENRLGFAGDCKRIVNEFDLDGIDMDWEYPTSSAAGISSSPDDTDNFTILMRNIREAIGKDKLLTMASVSSARFVDFPAIDEYMDFINIMSYDMGRPPHHHSPLYRSSIAGRTTTHEAVEYHLAAGIPASKLVVGMPFYGRGGKTISDFIDYRDIEKLEGYIHCWDEEAQAPYIIDEKGELVCGYDSPESLRIKGQYILDRGLLGGMYWEYKADNDVGDLRRALYYSLNPNVKE